MTDLHRPAPLRYALALCVLLVAPAPARAQAAAPEPVAPQLVAPWWRIAQMVAGYGLATAPAREIQPWILAPDEQTRALEFRGAFPNPFHAETAIRFTLPVSAHVSLRLYDVAGKLIRTLVDAQLPPGDHSAMLTAGELHSGVYFAVLRTGGVQVSRSVVLSR